MAEIAVQRGYNLRLAGKPEPVIQDADFPRKVAIRPTEFPLLKLRVLVKEGDRVQTGTPLMEVKLQPEIKFTSPASGTVSEVRRGPRRLHEQITVDVSEREEFVEFGPLNPATATREQIVAHLLRSGLWPRLRQHPFARVPHPSDKPKGIFVSGFCTTPLGLDPNVVVRGQGEALQVGFAALARLTDGKVHVGVSAGEPAAASELTSLKGVELHRVTGAHPAGNPVVQAFYIDRVRPGEVAWYLDIQDVIVVGKLCQTGRLSGERVYALSGNGVAPRHRRYYRSRFGVVSSILTDGKLDPCEQRVISGDILTGEKIAADQCVGFFDDMLTVVPEGRKRHWLGWLAPGRDKYSYSRTFLSALAPKDESFGVDTNLHGGHRACIQCGYCNDVCPTDVFALPTWKAVSYGDIEEAEKLGITDCVGCGLCTYVCPSKIEIDSILEEGLVKIQKEG